MSPDRHPAALYFDYLQEFFLRSEEWETPIINSPAIGMSSPFLDLILALDTCASYRRNMAKNKHPWLQCFIGCLIGCFGGTTTAMFFLGQTPGWLGSLGSPVAFFMGWWLIFLCPGDFFYKAISRNRWIEILFGYINTLSCGHAITSWGQDKALNAFHLAHTPGSGPLAIWCGTIAGCGGGILANWLMFTGKTSEWGFQTPVVLKGPSSTVKTAFLTSCFYYLVRNPHGWFSYGKDAFVSHDQARTIIWLFWVLVLTLNEIFKIPDPTRPVTNLIGKLLMCDSSVGAEPADGIYEKIFGKPAVAGVEKVAETQEQQKKKESKKTM